MYLSHAIRSLPQYSLKFNCVPDSKPFTAGRRNFTFLSLLLFLLLIIVIPVGYSITRYVHCKLSVLKHKCSLYGIRIRLQPSADCGPFRGQPFMHSVVNDTISNLNCDGQKTVRFFGSAGFIIPLIVFLL